MPGTASVPSPTVTACSVNVSGSAYGGGTHGSTGSAALNTPMLIVQGGRDYQATVADDLSRWQAALDGRPDVTIRVYPADNHLLFPGSGPSSPAEYEPVQHVDPAVVADVAAWLTAGHDETRAHSG